MARRTGPLTAADRAAIAATIRRDRTGARAELIRDEYERDRDMNDPDA